MACPSSNSTCPRAFFTMTRSIRSSSGVHVTRVSLPGVASTRQAASIRLRNRGLWSQNSRSRRELQRVWLCRSGDYRRQESSKILFVL